METNFFSWQEKFVTWILKHTAMSGLTQDDRNVMKSNKVHWPQRPNSVMPCFPTSNAGIIRELLKSDSLVGPSIGFLKMFPR